MYALLYLSHTTNKLCLLLDYASDDDIVAADILSQQKAIITLHPTS